jgi:N-acetylneuraminate synthase/N,N'-diacetyllegionaminate synthase
MRIKIAGKWIGRDKPVFIIAEGGINHNGSLKIAKKLVLAAKESGADAIKFQTFKASDLASPKSEYFKIFEKLELKDEEFEEISDYAKSNKIIFLSTPFGEQSVDLLNKIKVPAFKIASGDLTHIPLIEYVARKNKPVIISTGLANINEIHEAVRAIINTGNKKIAILHSISSYPTPPNEANLRAIRNLQEKFPFPIGYSDNGADNLVPVIAVAMGAKIIEKHFTLDKKMTGPDHNLSADPSELSKLVRDIQATEKMLGDGIKKCQPSELKNLIAARRSITMEMGIEKNTKLLKNMIGIKRPATGIEPKFIKKVIGKRVKKKMFANESLKWKHIR